MNIADRLRPALALSATLALVLTALHAAVPAPPGNFPGLRNAATAVGNAFDNAQSTGNTAANIKSDQSNSLESNTLLTIINKAFDADSGDMIDPENGTMKWKGHTYDLGQMRIFRARFQRYLELPPSSDQQAYQELLDKIFASLASNNPDAGTLDGITAAWHLLFQAAEFEADGGVALDVANQVFNAWRTREEKKAMYAAGLELERLRNRDQSSLVRNANLAQVQANKTGRILNTELGTALTVLEPLTAAPGANAPGGNTTSSTSGTASSPRAGAGSPQSYSTVRRSPTYDDFSIQVGAANLLVGARDLAVVEAKIKALQADELLTVTQAKLQFQSAIISLFLQRRFQHALIASSFYRFIFKGSAQELDPKFKKAVSDFFPGSADIPFTIGMVENLSREAVNDVKNGMAAVRANCAAGNYMAALERMQETFFLGEFLREVTQFDAEKRQTLKQLYTKIDTARKLADLKDYEGIIKLNGEIGALTKDFRSSEVTAAARSAEQMSSLALAGAKQAATMGDFDRAQSLLERAASTWPLNPEIASYGSGVSAGASISSQAAALFDDAYKHGEYRRIYERQGELAVGLINDAQRGPQFKDVIARMSRVEMALAQAQEAVAQNNAYAAWDAVAAAAELAPGDTAINQRKAELAPRVADYVGAAEKARAAEGRGETAASLAFYLAVQDINPGSPLARAGLERVAAKLLDRLASDGKPANVSVNAAAGAPASKPETSAPPADKPLAAAPLK